MNSIHLQQLLPDVFADRDSIQSDIWHRDFEFRRGELYLLEAASGTGKTSLCSYIYGIRSDYQGIISFDGQNIKSFDRARWTSLRKRSVSMLFQDLRLFAELTAYENVKLKNKLTGFKSSRQILSFFAQLGMEDKKDTVVGKLSFGQQQRVAFIRALCQPYDFIFLDEPISHLDDANSRLMADLLLQELSSQGAGAIVTSIGKSMELNYDKVLKL